MGTPEFAIPSLRILIEHGYNVVAVITALDKPSGRGRKLTPPPVKIFARDHKIPVLQPSNLKNPAFVEELKSYRANLQVVVAFRMLPEIIWSMPEFGTVNLHASLLPDYRGAAPINWVLINGESKTGLTTFFIKQEIDTGHIILKEEVQISEQDDAGTLHDTLMVKGAQLVFQTVQIIESGEYSVSVQPEGQELKKAPKIYREMCEIDWSQDRRQVYNFIRGLSPYPGAWTKMNDIIYKVYKTREVPDIVYDSPPGTYYTDNKSYLHMQCKNGILSVLELQPEGKKRMKIEDFFRGNRI